MQKFMVGGAVRDKLMGLEPKDVDFVVVGSTPEEMLAAGFQQVGADFPVFLDADGVEHALARTERKSGHGYNGFVTDHSADVKLEDDLMHRDLTVNAMAMSGNFVVDPFGGQEDMKNKVLRHVSPAFADDPVRVLRLARFHARFGPEWLVHTDTVLFARRMAAEGELKHLTRERVLKELEKALGEPHPKLFFDTLKLCNALEEVLPEVAAVHDKVDFVLVRFPHVSAKFKYASISKHMKDADAFETRLNVSTEWRKFAKMYRHLFRPDVPQPTAVDSLYAIDAYRQADLFEELVEDFRKTDALKYFQFFVDAFEKTRHVSFASLTPEQQATLKGPAIAEAIKAHRIALLEQPE